MKKERVSMPHHARQGKKMTKTFMMKLQDIQPSQLYISSAKLAQVTKRYDPSKPETLKPVPLEKIDNETIFVDGHTRALAAFLKGLEEIRVFWEDEELDWDEYRICVEWCKKEGIRTIGDLKNRVISPRQYNVLWLKRCEKMQQDLEARRKRKQLPIRKITRKDFGARGGI